MNAQNQLSLDQIAEADNISEILKMNAEEIENHGEKLSIKHSVAETPFGKVLIASTPLGICHAAFYDNKSEAVNNLKSRFRNAKYIATEVDAHRQALKTFHLNEIHTERIRLHIPGTPFQFMVWEALLEIPMGHLSTYGAIAKQIDKPKASRAVGTAIGKNPIAFLIPCHRVVQATGQIGGYMWGADRKYKIIAAEAAHIFGSDK